MPSPIALCDRQEESPSPRLRPGAKAREPGPRRPEGGLSAAIGFAFVNSFTWPQPSPPSQSSMLPPQKQPMPYLDWLARSSLSLDYTPHPRKPTPTPPPSTPPFRAFSTTNPGPGSPSRVTTRATPSARNEFSSFFVFYCFSLRLLGSCWTILGRQLKPLAPGKPDHACRARTCVRVTAALPHHCDLNNASYWTGPCPQSAPASFLASMRSWAPRACVSITRSAPPPVSLPHPPILVHLRSDLLAQTPTWPLGAARREATPAPNSTYDAPYPWWLPQRNPVSPSARVSTTARRARPWLVAAWRLPVPPRPTAPVSSQSGPASPRRHEAQ